MINLRFVRRKKSMHKPFSPSQRLQCSDVTSAIIEGLSCDSTFIHTHADHTLLHAVALEPEHLCSEGFRALLNIISIIKEIERVKSTMKTAMM